MDKVVEVLSELKRRLQQEEADTLFFLGFSLLFAFALGAVIF